MATPLQHRHGIFLIDRKNCALLLQVVIVQLGGNVFSTRPLSGAQWAACTGIGALSLLVRAGLRLLPPHPEVQDGQQTVS